MEAKVQREALLEPLFLVQSIVERKTTMPFLSHVCLRASGKRLEMESTDLEVALTVSVEAKVQKEGKVLVSAKCFYEIVREAPAGCEIALAQGDKGRIEVRAAGSQYKLGVVGVGEFPEIPRAKGAAGIQIQGALLDQMLGKVGYAVSSDESRQNLTGIYCELREGPALRMVATDGHRLSLIDRKAEGDPAEKYGVILPKKGVLGLQRLLSQGGEQKVTLVVDKRNTFVMAPSGSIVMRLIDAEYPHYEQVIPQKFSRTLSVQREGFISALKRSMIFSIEKAGGVRLELDKGSLKLSSSSPDLGESVEDLEATLEGKPLQVGFNARYLLDVLQVIPDERAVFELGDEVSPCVIRSEFDRGFTAVVMPMKL